MIRVFFAGCDAFACLVNSLSPRDGVTEKRFPTSKVPRGFIHTCNRCPNEVKLEVGHSGVLVDGNDERATIGTVTDLEGTFRISVFHYPSQG